jgi:nucleotidyltransferase substrate binding protein (TIGR01987 family)
MDEPLLIKQQRFEQRANDYIRAAARLGEACDQPFSPFMRDSVIQRFEFCWELAWKVLKLRLEQVGVVVLTPRDVFREALEKGLIEDGNTWSEAQRMRNLTSHTYDEKLADQVYQFLLSPGQQLFGALAHKVEEWRQEGA